MRLKALLALTTIVVLIGMSANTFGAKPAANRFIDNGNGTVTDTKTGLMWTKKDNGRVIGWGEARAFCRNLTLAGHKDWRLPTVAELETLYDKQYKRIIEFDIYAGSAPSETKPGSKVKRLKRTIFINPIFELTGTGMWSSETKHEYSSWTFDFYHGQRSVHIANNPEYLGVRVLPVRSIK